MVLILVDVRKPILDIFWLATAKVVLWILEREELNKTQTCVNGGVHVAA